MGNLVSTVGEDLGEGATNQLLASTSNEREEEVDLSSSERHGDISRLIDGNKETAQAGHRASRQTSPIPGPAGIWVPAMTEKAASTTGRGLTVRRSSGSLHSRRSSAPVPALATSYLKRHSAMECTAMAAEARRRASSPTSPPSPSPMPGRLSPASPSDEQRMLPARRLRLPASAPEVYRRSKEQDDERLVLPVDTVVNTVVPPQRLSAVRRLSHLKRSLLLSGVTLSLTSTILLVLTWKLLQEPLGDDLAQNVSHMALSLLPADGVLRQAVTRVGSLSVGDNESASADEATPSQPSVGGVAPLF
ncbi:uncharacterized protein [Dermacentor albipictus]|uniref:uncharacterized protein n=1 Tax=Dermacentor albipictus TaxID=60249 RepID=UPI0038FD1E16